MNTFLRNLQFIFRPEFWNLAYEYCPVWDKTLNELLDNNRFEKIKCYSGYVDGVYALGDYHIWAENYPYAYARNCFIWKNDKRGVVEYRPSRLTMLRMRERVKKDLNRRLAFRP